MEPPSDTFQAAFGEERDGEGDNSISEREHVQILPVLRTADQFGHLQKSIERLCPREISKLPRDFPSEEDPRESLRSLNLSPMEDHDSLC